MQLISCISRDHSDFWTRHSRTPVSCYSYEYSTQGWFICCSECRISLTLVNFILSLASYFFRSVFFSALVSFRALNAYNCRPLLNFISCCLMEYIIVLALWVSIRYIIRLLTNAMHKIKVRQEDPYKVKLQFLEQLFRPRIIDLHLFVILYIDLYLYAESQIEVQINSYSYCMMYWLAAMINQPFLSSR